MHFAVWIAGLLPLAQAGSKPEPEPGEVAPASAELSLAEKPAPSGIAIRFPELAGESLELVTCETVLVGAQDLGLSQVAPAPEDWKREDGAWSYTAKLGESLELTFRARGEAGGVVLAYTLRNLGSKALQDVQVHPCLPTVGAPSFYPGTTAQARGGRAERRGVKDASELWQRLYLWSKEEPFAFASSELAKSEPHLAFVARNGPVTEWGWWKNAAERWDRPLIALRSKDGKRTLALAFDSAVWASSNRGDARACFHLFPWFDDLAAGQSKTVKGQLRLVAGGLEETAKQLRRRE